MKSKFLVCGAAITAAALMFINPAAVSAQKLKPKKTTVKTVAVKNPLIDEDRELRHRFNGLNAVDDASEREDSVTGGNIKRAPLERGNKDIRITVDVPAFLMTFWQGENEVAVYHIGVGQKDYPIAISQRYASQVVLNPDWIPPFSSWVTGNIKPGVRISARDSRNPIGKIKIPLGDGYLLHQAKGVGDLGSLVSHGCVRVLLPNLVDVSKKIAVAYDLPTAPIDKVQLNKNQKVISLSEPLTVDINYDTMVVENGRLHIYPDVYDYGTNTVANLRSELAKYNVTADEIDDSTMQKMLARAVRKQQFVVSINDIKAGGGLTKGKVMPVVNRVPVKK